MRFKIILPFILFALSSFIINAQDYNIGVRAGLNWSMLGGELEQGETASFQDGFHFGINFTWNFTDRFGLRGEVSYTQNGHKKEYSGPSYFIIHSADYVDEGTLNSYLLEQSNASIGLPFTAHVRLSKKWEIFGGAYTNFIFGPTANGSLDYDSTIAADNIVIIQSLDYNYFDDVALEGNFIVPGIEVIVNGTNLVTVPQIAGAYYQFDEVEENLFKVIDVGLVGGFSYYFNPGFYASARAEYGFRDLTRRASDVSLRELNSGNGFVLRDDNDTHLGMQFSLGFKF